MKKRKREKEGKASKHIQLCKKVCKREERGERGKEEKEKEEHKMQTAHMNIVTDIHADRLEVSKQLTIQARDGVPHVTPEPLNSLIMSRWPGNMAPTIKTAHSQHILADLVVLTASVSSYPRRPS